ncbi:MAG: chemotaxis protein CheW [Pseudomonadaceae bacterium]|nr:chemotaxis protein CheW [Pseudomonadaceae bacterium]
MTWHDTPQQAIEDYLDALLHDDLLEEPSIEPLEIQGESQASKFAAAFSGGGFDEAPREESLQARQLSESMLQFKQAPQPFAEDLGRPVQLEESFTSSQVILPNLNLPSFEPAIETLADLVEEIETAEAVEEELVEEEFAEAFTEDFQETFTEELVVEAEPLVETSIETAVKEEDLDAGQPPSPPGWKDGRPIWAQERFECLLFKVKGLTLAVPLVELGGIIKIEKQPTPLFGQPDWFIGILRNNKMNISMVDTAQWVLPPALIKKNQDPYKLVIRIHDSTWGLACNEVDRSISLKPEQVRWRTSLGKRPWLAGTVIEHMCALIDATAFDRLLKQGHGDLEPVNLKALKKLNNE